MRKTLARTAAVGATPKEQALAVEIPRIARHGIPRLLIAVCLLSFGAVSCGTTAKGPDQAFEETPLPSSTTSAGATGTKAGPSCPVREEIPVRDLQNDELVDCDLKDVRILFEDGRTMATPGAGEVVTGAPSTIVGSEDLESISVANLGRGLGVVGFIENEAREVTYWGPAEATSILKEQHAKANMAGG